jgi:hypothetical protein
MVVTRSYASKYNLKLNDGLDNTRKNNYEYDNNYIFRFIYLLFYISFLILLFFMLVNYFTENKYLNHNFIELNSNKKNNFILLENNIPEKTLEYLSIGLYDKLPAKSYEKNYNYFDNLYNEFLYKLLTEDRYNYYLNFFN